MEREPAMEPGRALEAGAALFDAGRWFDAHEAWEDAWRVERGARRLLLQGLIQIAAGFHKGLVQGRPAGMVRLLGNGLAKREATGALASPLAPFRGDVEGWREAARAWADGGVRPSRAAPRLGPMPTWASC
jgi:uncharacterized protein